MEALLKLYLVLPSISVHSLAYNFKKLKLLKSVLISNFAKKNKKWTNWSGGRQYAGVSLGRALDQSENWEMKLVEYLNHISVYY